MRNAPVGSNAPLTFERFIEKHNVRMALLCALVVIAALGTLLGLANPTCNQFFGSLTGKWTLVGLSTLGGIMLLGIFGPFISSRCHQKKENEKKMTAAIGSQVKSVAPIQIRSPERQVQPKGVSFATVHDAFSPEPPSPGSISPVSQTPAQSPARGALTTPPPEDDFHLGSVDLSQVQSTPSKLPTPRKAIVTPQAATSAAPSFRTPLRSSQVSQITSTPMTPGSPGFPETVGQWLSNLNFKHKPNANYWVSMAPLPLTGEQYKNHLQSICPKMIQITANSARAVMVRVTGPLNQKLKMSDFETPKK